ncbi:MAG: hypothetical protein ACRD6W_08345, partial [Nitrososphaerales archaeon]
MTAHDTNDRDPDPQSLGVRFDEDLGALSVTGVTTGAAGAVEVSPARALHFTLDAVSGEIADITFDQDWEQDDESRKVLAHLVGESGAQAMTGLSKGAECTVSVAASRGLVLHRLGLLNA